MWQSWVSHRVPSRYFLCMGHNELTIWTTNSRFFFFFEKNSRLIQVTRKIRGRGAGYQILHATWHHISQLEIHSSILKDKPLHPLTLNKFLYLLFTANCILLYTHTNASHNFAESLCLVVKMASVCASPAVAAISSPRQVLFTHPLIDFHIV